MGRDLAERFAVARATFAEVDERLDRRLSALCFEGPADELALTENAQPGILTTSVALFRALAETTRLQPSAVAGHSLGEWTALVVAGALPLADAAAAVQERGRLMQSAVPVGQGAMAAVLGLEADAVGALCREAAEGDVLEVANLNGGGQVVVAGHAAAVERLVVLVAGQRARARRLDVSAPFHCALMAPAAAGLGRYLEGVRFRDPTIPVITSVEARQVRGGAELASLLVRQVTEPVRWEETARAVVAAGPAVTLEVGPGNVLAGLYKRIAPAQVVVGVADAAGVERAAEALA